jgi:hypothetical protein
MWFDGTDWLEIGIPGFTPSQALFTSLSFDGGYPLIAFQDYDGGTYKASVMKYEPCFDADLPTLSLSESTICKNMPLTLSITSGDLNSADYWSIYTGGCGGSLVGTFSGSSAILLPQGNTTYYVRGEPACITPVSCASIAVNVTPIDSSVTVSGATLTAVSSGGVYEWLNCSTGFSVIAGQKSQSFTAPVSGSYALKISENGCTDTSSCYIFSAIGLDQNHNSEFSVFPNPAIDLITIQFANSENTTVRILDLKGVEQETFYIQNQSSVLIDISRLADGIYIIQVITTADSTSKQIIIK